MTKKSNGIGIVELSGRVVVGREGHLLALNA